MRDIQKHVEQYKARHKWLKGGTSEVPYHLGEGVIANVGPTFKGVEFIDAIPKSPSGKILRRMLRDKDREVRRQKGARL